MKWIICENKPKHFEIVPSNAFIFFWWAMYKNIRTWFLPIPYCLTIYYKTIKDARKVLISKNATNKKQRG